MLNCVLRPMLTKWHYRLLTWELHNPELDEFVWPDRCEFWESLNETAEPLRGYAGLFAEAAGVPEFPWESGATNSTP